MSVELEESKSNVNKRLEFIEGEIKKVDNSIDSKRADQNRISDEVIFK